MPQYIIGKQEKIQAHHLEEIYKISSSTKIMNVLEQENDRMILYDKNAYHDNHFISIIPDRIFVRTATHVIFSDPIEVPLDYFPETLVLLQHFFPHIYNFTTDKEIVSVKIKPSHRITTSNNHTIDMGVNDVQMMTEFMTEPKYSHLYDTLIIIELIRKFYIGEMDKLDGLMIYKNNFKFIRALLEQDFTARDITDKLEDNPGSVDISPFFKGSDRHRFMKVLGNEIIKTPTEIHYTNNLDLKFAGLAQIMMEVLNKRRFGKDR